MGGESFTSLSHFIVRCEHQQVPTVSSSSRTWLLAGPGCATTVSMLGGCLRRPWKNSTHFPRDAGQTTRLVPGSRLFSASVYGCSGRILHSVCVRLRPGRSHMEIWQVPWPDGGYMFSSVRVCFRSNLPLSVRRRARILPLTLVLLSRV